MTGRRHAGWLMASFTDDDHRDGNEQVRFAVAIGDEPTHWHPLAGWRPILASTVGEHGARDPFLVRDGARFVLIATDLRTTDAADWDRAVRHGSTGVLVWESVDLVDWTGPDLVPIAVPGAGNAWAPKAYPLPDGSWQVYFASSVHPAGSDRTTATHQRMFVARTRDFRSFEPAEVYLDPGHDVIDVAFLQLGGSVQRFAADARTDDPARAVQFVRQESGSVRDDPCFTDVVDRIGAGVLRRGEGPAVFADPVGDGAWLFIDEFTFRGYQLFRSHDPARGRWEHVPGTVLPPGVKHGSVLSIDQHELDRLVDAFGIAAAG